MNDELANYLISWKDNYEEHSYDEEIAKDYNMAMNLKPGEELIRWWRPELGKYEGRGRKAAIRVDDLQDTLHTRPSVFSLPIRSAYPIVGGRFFCTLVKEDPAGLASISFGRPTWGDAHLYTYRWGTGLKIIELDLDSRLGEHGDAYSYMLGFSLKGNAGTRPPAQARVASFRSVTDMQVSHHSLPGTGPWSKYRPLLACVERPGEGSHHPSLARVK